MMALLIKRLHKGRGFFLAGLYWPCLVSAAVGMQITLFLFNPTDAGILNVIAKALGGKARGWLIDKQTALLSLMILPFLTGFSMKMMIFYSGLLSIPKAYYEAASLETNSRAQIAFKITFPLLTPVFFFNILLSVIEGLRVIAPMQLITPDNDYTMSGVYYLYRSAFKYQNFAYAFALGFILFVIIISLSLLQEKLKKDAVVYE